MSENNLTPLTEKFQDFKNQLDNRKLQILQDLTKKQDGKEQILFVLNFEEGEPADKIKEFIRTLDDPIGQISFLLRYMQKHKITHVSDLTDSYMFREGAIKCPNTQMYYSSRFAELNPEENEGKKTNNEDGKLPEGIGHMPIKSHVEPEINRIKRKTLAELEQDENDSSLNDHQSTPEFNPASKEVAAVSSVDSASVESGPENIAVDPVPENKFYEPGDLEKSFNSNNPGITEEKKELQSGLTPLPESEPDNVESAPLSISPNTKIEGMATTTVEQSEPRSETPDQALHRLARERKAQMGQFNQTNGLNGNQPPSNNELPPIVTHHPEPAAAPVAAASAPSVNPEPVAENVRLPEPEVAPQATEPSPEDLARAKAEAEKEAMAAKNQQIQDALAGLGLGEDEDQNENSSSGESEVPSEIDGSNREEFTARRTTRPAAENAANKAKAAELFGGDQEEATGAETSGESDQDDDEDKDEDDGVEYVPVEVPFKFLSMKERFQNRIMRKKFMIPVKDLPEIINRIQQGDNAVFREWIAFAKENGYWGLAPAEWTEDEE